MKFPKNSFLVLLSAKFCLRHHLSIKSIFRNSVSHEQRVKIVKFCCFLAHLAPKNATALCYPQNFPIFCLFSLKFGVFAVSLLITGKISIKASQITVLVKIFKNSNLTSITYILVYIVITYSLVCIPCTYCVSLCK